MSHNAGATPDTRRITADYQKQVADLLQFVTSTFQIPADEAEALVHDVMLTSLLQHTHVDDRATWLLGAVTCAAQKYERDHRRSGAE